MVCSPPQLSRRLLLLELTNLRRVGRRSVGLRANVASGGNAIRCLRGIAAHQHRREPEGRAPLIRPETDRPPYLRRLSAWRGVVAEAGDLVLGQRAVAADVAVLATDDDVG